MIKDAVEAIKQVGPSFEFEPFSSRIQPIIEEALNEHSKANFRKGTILTPLIMVWLVLSLTLRRDTNYNGTLNWMLSGIRWLTLDLPTKLVQDGAISHARVKLGVDVFRSIFYKFASTFGAAKADFHQWMTVIFDGTAMTMPDTKSNLDRFGRHKSGRGYGAFPQLRAVALLALSARKIIDFAYAPIRGKKTGERTLVFEILDRCKGKNLLFLLDAGFYSFFSSPIYPEKRKCLSNESGKLGKTKADARLSNERWKLFEFDIRQNQRSNQIDRNPKQVE